VEEKGVEMRRRASRRDDGGGCVEGRRWRGRQMGGGGRGNFGLCWGRPCVG